MLFRSLNARPMYGRSRGLHALQQDESHWASVAVNSCLHEIARIGPTAKLSDQRARGSGRLGRHMATVDQQIAEVKLGFLCHPKKLTGDRIARGESAASPAQKLPPAAICCNFVAAKPLRSFQPLNSLCRPLRDVTVGTPEDPGFLFGPAPVTLC